ncbi:hypothetical protein [Arthrobacter rhizosphaerae]|nr:hypothetical protein [Arthrobacter rhizosphaerae]
MGSSPLQDHPTLNHGELDGIEGAVETLNKEAAGIAAVLPGIACPHG